METVNVAGAATIRAYDCAYTITIATAAGHRPAVVFYARTLIGRVAKIDFYAPARTRWMRMRPVSAVQYNAPDFFEMLKFTLNNYWAKARKQSFG